MANITETVSYDAGVYLISTTDPVQGGAGGIANMAAQNLANRTAYLKQHIDNLENGTTIPPGLATIASPTFTGDPKAPTPALGDNDTSIATTAFVQGTIGGLLNKSVAGAANVTLTAVEAGYGLLNFTGALTGNIAVIVPTSPTRQWTVMNNTTGAFTLTVKTASGAGVVVTQGKTVELFTEGANVVLSTSDFASAVMAAGTTGYLQPQFDNSSKLATTAFVQRAGLQASNFAAIVGATTLNTSHAGATIYMGGTGNYTVTLPAVSTFVPGARIELINAAGTSPVIIARSGSDLIVMNAGMNVTSIATSLGDTLTLESSGSGWVTVGGSVQLPYAAAMGGAGFVTQPQFDGSTKLATTAFVARALGNFSSSTTLLASTTLTSADAGKFFALGNSGLTLTLPPISSVAVGSRFSMQTGSGVWSVVPSGSDRFAFNASQQTVISLGVGDSLSVVSDGTYWRHIGGTAELPYGTQFASSFSGSAGYQRLPSGLILQWFNITLNHTAGQAVLWSANLPTAFPNTCMEAFISPGSNIGPSAQPVVASVEGLGTSGVNGYAYSADTNSRVWRVFAIGY